MACRRPPVFCGYLEPFRCQIALHVRPALLKYFNRAVGRALEHSGAPIIPYQRECAFPPSQSANRVTFAMRMLGFMFALTVLGLLVLFVSRNVDRTFLSSANLDSASPRTPANPPDEVAFGKIQREDLTGRFPFLVSTLCRQFLELHPGSSRRAEVEEILRRNQAKIDEPERSKDKNPVGSQRRE